jgi:hypothetical protein
MIFGFWENVSKLKLGHWNTSFVVVCCVSWLMIIFALFYQIHVVVVLLWFYLTCTIVHLEAIWAIKSY